MRGSTDLVSLKGFDKDAQEDARELTFAPGGSIEIAGTGRDEAYRIVYELTARPEGRVLIRSGAAVFDATLDISVAAGKGWREMVLTPACLPELDNTLGFETDGAMTLRIDTIVREDLDEQTPCAF